LLKEIYIEYNFYRFTAHLETIKVHHLATDVLYISLIEGKGKVIPLQARCGLEDG